MITCSRQNETLLYPLQTVHYDKKTLGILLTKKPNPKYGTPHKTMTNMDENVKKTVKWDLCVSDGCIRTILLLLPLACILNHRRHHRFHWS
mmetsp:Transcript_29972/g.69126  ORF Transcript_29972/g.69126 Transcript_29972/m.69126 type:complete len:91 (+) Transcript_29972:669-941(+)